MDNPHDMQMSPRPGDGDVTTALGIRSPAKQFAARYRGVMMRPMSTAVSKAQFEYKPFVTDAGEIDHNLYGKFLGLLKDAGVPWKARRLPESREDAMHIMNAMVAAVNAYQYYQRDVERAYHDIEASISATKTHTHNQAADVQKLQNEVAALRRKLAGTENTAAKMENSCKDQIAGLKSKLSLTERDLIDSHIQFRKLERMLQEEKRHSDSLMSKILTADKPRYGKAPASGRRVAKEGSYGSVDVEHSGGSVGRQNGSMIPSVRPKPRSALPWEDYEADAPQHNTELLNTAPVADTREEGMPRSRPYIVAAPSVEAFRLEPRSARLRHSPDNKATEQTALAHVKVRIPGSSEDTVEDSGSDVGSISGEMSDGIPPTEAPTEIEVRKSKSRFKRLLGKLRMSRPNGTADSITPTPPRSRNVPVVTQMLQAAN